MTRRPQRTATELVAELEQNSLGKRESDLDAAGKRSAMGGADPEAAAKITAGHEQIARARSFDSAAAEVILQQAKNARIRAGNERDVLERHGHKMNPMILELCEQLDSCCAWGQRMLATIEDLRDNSGLLPGGEK